jgi:hypothetical protein
MLTLQLSGLVHRWTLLRLNPPPQHKVDTQQVTTVTTKEKNQNRLLLLLKSRCMSSCLACLITRLILARQLQRGDLALLGRRELGKGNDMMPQAARGTAQTQGSAPTFHFVCCGQHSLIQTTAIGFLQ